MPHTARHGSGPTLAGNDNSSDNSTDYRNLSSVTTPSEVVNSTDNSTDYRNLSGSPYAPNNDPRQDPANWDGDGTPANEGDSVTGGPDESGSPTEVVGGGRVPSNTDEPNEGNATVPDPQGPISNDGTNPTINLSGISTGVVAGLVGLVLILLWDGDT